MKKIVAPLIFLIGFVSCRAPENHIHEFSPRIPGEFEPHEALWLGYKTGENASGKDSVTIKLIQAIHPYVKLNLIIEHDSLAPNTMMELDQEGIDTTNIRLVYQSPTDIWYRDPGPIFCITSENKLAVVDFKYTNYSNVPPDSLPENAIAHEGIDRDIAKRLNIDTVNSIVAMEGGAFETNGKGVLIQVEAITLKRNPHLTKDQIEKDFARCCGIEKVIWLPSGVADDPHNFNRIIDNIYGLATGGHTDEFVRFANDSTILLSWVDEEHKEDHPINRLNYDILKENYRILSEARNTDGKPFRIIKVPHPDPSTDMTIVTNDWFESDYWKMNLEKFNITPGDTIYWALSKSYMNYLLTNEVAVIPQYGTDSTLMNEKDDAVRNIFEELYPNKKIVGINPISLNEGGGGMHCRFQTQPRIE